MSQPSFKRLGIAVAGLTLFALLLAAPTAEGVGGDFAAVDFTAAAPLTYDHDFGGGAYDDRTVGKSDDIVESLEGGDFACGELVTFLTAIRMEDVTVDPVQTAEFDFSFLADSTGQSGVALGDIVNVWINYGPVSGGDGPGGTDSGIIDDGGSVAILTSEMLTGPLFVSGSELLGTVRVTDLEAGEQVILRIDVRLFCDPGSRPTGNLQAVLEAGRVVDPAPDTINTGAQTIPFKRVGEIPKPVINVVKTVTTEGGTCPGMDTLTIFEGETVKFCYEVTNPGTVDLFDVVLWDDNATPMDPGDDFIVPLTDLADLDGDGEFDDLAAGATAHGEYLTTFFDIGTFENCATASGHDAAGTTVTDTDCASVTVEDIPEAFLEIIKTVTTEGGSCPGVDSLVINVGDTVKFCYTVTNPGNWYAVDVVVWDDNATPGDPADDFMVPLVGLTDEDGDGFADDLAAGATATGEWLKTFFDPGTFTNCATVTGFNGFSGDPLSDVDCATVTAEEEQLCVDDFLIGVFHDQNGAYILIDPATGQGWPIMVGGVDLFAGLNGITSVSVDRPTDSFYVPTGDLDDALYRTDLITALTSRVGFFTNGATNIQAMDLAPQVSATFGFMPGYFYGISIDGIGGCYPNCFFRIDKQTGDSVPIAGLPLQQGRGVSFNPVTGEFWVFDSGTKSLYTLDAFGNLTFKFSVPASNLEACTGIDTAFSLAHDCFGNLYTVDIAHGVLLRIDIAAEQAFCVGLPGTLVGPGGSRDIQGLDGYYIRTVVP